MKPLILVLAALALAACSMEAQQIDRDWGKAQMASWDSIISNPHPSQTTNPPTGLEGINAEGVMDVYNSGFWAQQKQTDVFSLGVISSGKRP